jgi:hypothetical protein
MGGGEVEEEEEEEEDNDDVSLMRLVRLRDDPTVVDGMCW